MSKWAVMLACLFISFSVFSACDDDDEEGGDSLVGVWQETEYDDEPYVFTFNADKTGSYYDPEDGYSTDFEWSVNGNVLNWDWSSHEWYFRLEGDMLYIYYQLSDYNDNDPEWILRKQS